MEYKLGGVTQGTVYESGGFDYSSALSAIMRQNPDAIIVGEIRDKKTAYAVIQAALTGHKVFTTFHTENSTGALTRLLNIGVENFLISETVVYVISQRLLRTSCPDCIDEYRPGMGMETGENWNKIASSRRKERKAEKSFSANV